MLGAISQRLLSDAQGVGETGTTPQAFRHCGALTTTHTVEWGDGVAAGVVEIESAASEAYAGTWTPEATITFAGVAPKADSVTLAGMRGAFRHRIVSTVVDGAVTTKITGSL